MSNSHFLMLKPWHPANKVNQKIKFIAEAKEKHRKEEERRAEEYLKKATDFVSQQQLVKDGHGADIAQHPLKFMYAPPPGMDRADRTAAIEAIGEGHTEEADTAVQQFLRAVTKEKAEEAAEEKELKRREARYTAVSQLSELERANGARVKMGMSLEEQRERFPMLKNAPVEGAYAEGVNVQFNPLGKVVRHVRCHRCKGWGHTSGDRECPMKDINPNDPANLIRMDPLTRMKAAMGEPVGDDLKLKRGVLGPSAGAAEYSILSDDEDDVATFMAKKGWEEALLASLSKEERGMLESLSKRKSKKHKKEKKKSSKKKKKKGKRRRSSSSRSASPAVDSLEAAKARVAELEAKLAAQAGATPSAAPAPSDKAVDGGRGRDKAVDGVDHGRSLDRRDRDRSHHRDKRRREDSRERRTRP